MKYWKRLEKERMEWCTKGKKKDNHRPVAMKLMKREKPGEDLPVTSQREIQFLRHFDHQNIVKLLEICQREGESEDQYHSSIYLVFEYCEYDLAAILSSRRIRLTLPDQKNIIYQLLNGLSYIHCRRIIHRDIKPSNILLNREGLVKLADFGLSCSHRPNQRHNSLVMALWYRAPELLLGSQAYGTEIDMWGVGCVMAEVMTRRPLVRGHSEQDQFRRITILFGSMTKEVWPGVVGLERYNSLPRPSVLQPRRLKEELLPAVKDEHAMDLIDRLLCLNPEQRINCDEALQHDFMWVEPNRSKSLKPMLSQLPPVHELDLYKKYLQQHQQQQHHQPHHQRQHHQQPQHQQPHHQQPHHQQQQHQQPHHQRQQHQRQQHQQPHHQRQQHPHQRHQQQSLHAVRPRYHPYVAAARQPHHHRPTLIDKDHLQDRVY